jgi:hypothetical protein
MRKIVTAALAVLLVATLVRAGEPMSPEQRRALETLSPRQYAQWKRDHGIDSRVNLVDRADSAVPVPKTKPKVQPATAEPAYPNPFGTTATLVLDHTQEAYEWAANAQAAQGGKDGRAKTEHVSSYTRNGKTVSGYNRRPSR